MLSNCGIEDSTPGALRSTALSIAACVAPARTSCHRSYLVFLPHWQHLQHAVHLLTQVAPAHEHTLTVVCYSLNNAPAWMECPCLHAIGPPVFLQSLQGKIRRKHGVQPVRMRAPRLDNGVQ